MSLDFLAIKFLKFYLDRYFDWNSTRMRILLTSFILFCGFMTEIAHSCAPSSGLLRRSRTHLNPSCWYHDYLSKHKPFSPATPVRIVETGPRDNLQNLKTPDGKAIILTPEQRIRYIHQLIACAKPGYPFKIDVGSFVQPNTVPQMVGSSRVLLGLPNLPNITYSFIVPNIRGFDDFLKAIQQRENDIKPEVAVTLSASESFSKANIGCSIQDSLTKSYEVLKAANSYGFPTRAYISMFFGDQLESINVVEALKMVGNLYALHNCGEIVLCDTAGVADSKRIETMCREAASVVPPHRLALHLHAQPNQKHFSLKNIWAGYLAGIEVFDAGNLVIDHNKGIISGCPYSPGAPKNISTKDLVNFFEAQGVTSNLIYEETLKVHKNGLTF